MCEGTTMKSKNWPAIHSIGMHLYESITETPREKLSRISTLTLSASCYALLANYFAPTIKHINFVFVVEIAAHGTYVPL